ncbi:MAG: potassium-transporting ATPase subunit C [Vicinamibacterales bacterium]
MGMEYVVALLISIAVLADLAAAQFQVPWVARERGVAPADLRSLIDRYTEGRTFGLLGEPRVNVLERNLALDARYPPTR